MEHPYILGISVCPLPMTRSSSPEISTCLSPEFDLLGWHPWTWRLLLPVWGFTQLNAQSLSSLLWLHPTFQKVFFSCPLEPGVCICVDQVVRSRIRVTGITRKNVFKVLAQCPEHSGDLLQSFLPSLFDMGPTACWRRILFAPILSTDLLYLLPPALLSSILKLSLSSWPPEQSQHLSSASHSSRPESPLGFSSSSRTELPQAEPTPLSPTPHSSLTSLIDKRVLLHFSVVDL